MQPRLKRQVVRAVPWSLAESVVNGLVGVGTVLAYAWLLLPEEVGRATIALATVGFLELAAALGMAEAVVGARSGDTRVTDTAFTASLTAAIVAAGLAFALAEPVAALYGDPDLAALMRLAIVLLVANTLLVVPTGMLTRKMRAGAVTMRMTLSRVVGLVLTVGLAAAGFGAAAIVAGMGLGALASLVAVFATMRRWPRLRFAPREFRRLIAFGSALSAERLVWGALPRLFWLLVGYIHGPTVLGYFQFAQRLIDETATLAQTFSVRFGLSFFASLERLGQDATEAFLKATRMILVVAAPVFAGIALTLPLLVGTVFSEAWAPATIIGQVAAIGWIFALPRTLVGPVLRAKGHQGGLVAYALAALAVSIGGVLLTGGLGLTAIAAAWVARHLIGLPWGLYATRRYLALPLRRQAAAFARPILATLLMALAVTATASAAGALAPVPRLALMVVVGIVSYAAAIAVVDRPSLRIALSIGRQLRVAHAR